MRIEIDRSFWLLNVTLKFLLGYFMFISIMLGIWGLVNLFYFNLDLFFLLKRIKLKRVFMKS